MGNEWLYNMSRRIGLVKSNKPTDEEKDAICPETSSPEGEARDKELLRYKKASKNEIKYTAEETAMICEITRLSGRCSETCESCALYREDNHGEGGEGE